MQFSQNIMHNKIELVINKTFHYLFLNAIFFSRADLTNFEIDYEIQRI